MAHLITDLRQDHGCACCWKFRRKAEEWLTGNDASPAQRCHTLVTTNHTGRRFMILLFALVLTKPLTLHREPHPLLTFSSLDSGKTGPSRT